MIYTITTDTPLETVKEEMLEHAKAEGFGILGNYEFKKILQSKGLDLNKEITGYEICNPKAAQDVMSEYPEISVFLPCRISVYEEGGKTVLSTVNINTVMNGVDVSQEFKEHISSVYAKFVNIMNSWN